MKYIADWYLWKYYRYNGVYRNSKAPHLLPKYVLDKSLIQEISYQTIRIEIKSLLLGSSKNICPTFPINIGNYTLSNGPHDRKEAEAL